ncbi:TIGR02680 family protein [Microbacterium sp.]|uniref:TIGR02680 family protein n=1 Tax=Microbacterium sp. TaxID=51671 RepID=UPI0039E62A13
MTLPTPSSGRYKPLRCGLVELFLYEAQEFPFRDGRLLLRGDNGSGKSKVLALTLPLLLDANLAPARMEPDADPNKRMAWNLLLGDAYDERTGYSWIEFGRVDDEGAEQFVTLGLGIKAVQHKGVARHWWFVTDQRIGGDLHLIDRTRTARTRERLIEAIGDRGAVFDTADRYRRAVDEALFGLHGRYDALVDLLIQLRQPQLSKRPNEQQLTRALSESLPPMPEALIDTVAQSYQALEDEERALARLRSSAAAVRTFIAEYTRYARVAALRATAQPRRAQSDYEGQTRRARDAASRAERAIEGLAAAEAVVEQDKTMLAGLSGSRDALRERRGSDEMRQFAASRDLADAKRRAADVAGSAAGDAASAHAHARRLLDEARVEVEREHEDVARSRSAASTIAGTAGIDISASDDADLVVREAAAELRRRQEHVAHVDGVIGTRETADGVRAEAQRRADEATAQLEAEDERMRAAQDAAQSAASAWLERSRQHLNGCRLLRDDGVDAALDAATDWAAAPADGATPLARWAQETVRARDAELEEERIVVEGELQRVKPLIDDLTAEIMRLDAGGVRTPQPPRTRAARRDDATGAAFWECVDVRAYVAADDAAGLEAALEASGLLDAWVGLDGSARGADDDVLLQPVPQEGPTLADLLDPLEVRGVSVERVGALLRSVALDDTPREGQVAVSTRGAFALGPLVGSWRKPVAEYLGATAREAARLARLVTARVEHEQLVAERAEWAARGGSIRERRRALVRERDEMPSDAEVRRTSDAAASAAKRRSVANDDLSARQTTLAGAIETHRQAAAAVDEAAALYGIDLAAIEDVRDALRALPAGVERLVDAIRRLARCTARLTEREATLAESSSLLAAAEIRAISAADEAVVAEHHRDTLEATVGKEAREIETQLAVVEGEISTASALLTVHEKELRKASDERAVSESAAVDIEKLVAEATVARDAASESFRLFADTGLLALATPDLDIPDPATPWAPDPTVRLARRVLEVLGGQDPTDDVWDVAVGRLRRAFETLQGELSTQGRQSAWDQRHSVTVVTIQHGSQYVSPEHLGVELDGELAERERLLSAKERAILETHLIDEVGAQLHERVRDAMAQVGRINHELAQRPTRSGLKLRIVWDPADGDLDKEGRSLLQQNAAAWSPADREAIGEYLRSRIAAARADDPEASWHERLAHAFDYRAWNTFAVQLHQGRGWRPATGPASSGERVLAGSVPLFAAAASHYASAANPHAPRIVLLDEAFAGVDDRSRANYLGLLAEFDLDVVMTSEREWATYPEIPGIAISNLFRLPGTDAVHVEHWTWDGTERRRAAEPGTTAIEPEPPVDWSESALALDLGDVT